MWLHSDAWLQVGTPPSELEGCGGISDAGEANITGKRPRELEEEAGGEGVDAELAKSGGLGCSLGSAADQLVVQLSSFGAA